MPRQFLFYKPRYSYKPTVPVGGCDNVTIEYREIPLVRAVENPKLILK